MLSTLAEAVGTRPGVSWVLWGLAKEAGFWSLAYVCAVTLDKPLLDRLLPRLSAAVAGAAPSAASPGVDAAGDAEREAAQRRALQLIAATFVGMYAAALWGGGSAAARLLDPLDSSRGSGSARAGAGMPHHRGRVR